MKNLIKARFEECALLIERSRKLLSPMLEQAVHVIIDCYRSGGGVFLFGNGGSAADAQHVAGELVGRFLQDRRALKAQALSTDTSVLTALANDYGYEYVFARQLEANARSNDVAIALTTSGNSPNVVAGLAKAREMGLTTIALTGMNGGQCAELADLLIDVPSDHTPHVQEVHMLICHVICEFVERTLASGY